MTPGNPAQLRQLARETARSAVALVEVDVRSAFDPRTGRGELMRVHRTHAGRAPREFRVARGNRPPSSASCDVEYAPRSRALVLLYPAERQTGRAERAFRESGLCVSLLLQNARFRQMLIEAMRRRPAGGQTSVSSAAAPCGNAA